MTKERSGYRVLFAQIPEVLWNRLADEVEATGASMAVVITELLRKHYRVNPKELPAPKRPGRKPKKR